MTESILASIMDTFLAEAQALEQAETVRPLLLPRLLLFCSNSFHLRLWRFICRRFLRLTTKTDLLNMAGVKPAVYMGKKFSSIKARQRFVDALIQSWQQWRKIHVESVAAHNLKNPPKRIRKKMMILHLACASPSNSILMPPLKAFPRRSSLSNKQNPITWPRRCVAHYLFFPAIYIANHLHLCPCTSNYMTCTSLQVQHLPQET
jgi:hypothetical protein